MRHPLGPIPGGVKLNKTGRMATTPTAGSTGSWPPRPHLGCGDAGLYGSAGGTAEQARRGHGGHPVGGGYWLVASDSGVFSYGDAGFSLVGGGRFLGVGAPRWGADRCRRPAAPAPVVRSRDRGPGHHRARLRLRPVRRGGRAGGRVDAARSRCVGCIDCRQGRAVRNQHRRGPGDHPPRLVGQPPPDRDRGPLRAPSRDPDRHDGRPGTDCRRRSQSGLLVVRRHFRFRAPAAERHERAR